MEDPAKEVDSRTLDRLLFEKVVRHQCNPFLQVLGYVWMLKYVWKILYDATDERMPLYYFDTDMTMTSSDVYYSGRCFVTPTKGIPVEAVNDMFGTQSRK